MRLNVLGKVKRFGFISFVTLALVLTSSESSWSVGPKPPPHPLYIDFPKDFKWCTATAGHQNEGNNVNSDWWEWEKREGWPEAGIADDHWNRLEEDTKLLSDLNLKQFRMSIEWAKIEPQPGVWDWNAVQHYKNELALLKERGIQPLVTLYHWIFPKWVRDRGGFEWSGTPQAMARFADFVITHIAPEVVDWITINEPMVHLTLGYAADRQPPARRGEKGAMKSLIEPMIGLLKSHAAMYWALKQKAAWQDREIRISIAHHLRNFDPLSSFNLLDVIGANIFDYAFNWMVPDAIQTGRLKVWIPGQVDVDEEIPGLKGTQDYFGLNYYTRDRVHVDLTGAPDKWLITEPDPDKMELYPAGFYRVLKDIHKRYPDLTVFVTENGLSDGADLKRQSFLENHLYALHKAMSEGVSVRGYCYWTLMDNFEWTLGYVPKFGLYEVDRADGLKRTPRPSAFFFSALAKNSGLWVTPFEMR